jgi:uncharacterized protein YbgA (DUF1722 family)
MDDMTLKTDVILEHYQNQYDKAPNDRAKTLAWRDLAAIEECVYSYENGEKPSQRALKTLKRHLIFTRSKGLVIARYLENLLKGLED